MSDRLTESEVRKIAFGCGLNEKGVMRLLGSQRIQLAEEISLDKLLLDVEENAVEEKFFDIGLRISPPEILVRLLIVIDREQLLEQITELFREYVQSCPLITAWVGRGDFKTNKLPERVGRQQIRHASVTAGRLRAKLLRLAQDGTEPH